MHNQRLRSLARGVTLIEVMIVVTIMGLIASAVAIAVTRQMREAQIKTTIMNEKAIRPIAALWRSDHPGDECPTTEQLRADGLLDASSSLTDAWGNRYIITCEANETSVVSYGPDKRPDTPDDLREPDPDHGKVAQR
jgi:general secretion pathway protein G